jgi:4-nitrophenyl phosphatase
MQIPNSIQALVLDMDGVLWKEDAPIGDLPALFRHIRQRGLKFAFATNNGTRTPQQLAERLQGFGVEAEPSQVITSALGVANLLAKRFPQGTPVFAVGESGVISALRERGLEPVPLEDFERAQAVVSGFDHQISFDKMAAAALLIRRGIPFYATNPDRTYPTPRGEIPGAGAWASVLITASGVQPIFAGKPSRTLIDLARERLGTTEPATLVVGDRIETDIAAGQAAGCPVALVLSGVTRLEDALLWKPVVDLIADSLSTLVGLT